MKWVALAWASLWASSLLLLGRSRFFELARSSARLLDSLLADLSHAQEEQALRQAVWQTLISLLLFVGVLLLSLGGAWGCWAWLSPDDLLPSPQWLAVCLLIVGGLIPYGVYRLWVGKQVYGDMARLWHELFLDHSRLHIALGGIDHRFRRTPMPPTQSTFVIISGLSRAGTTSFTQQLHQVGRFSSLGYQHMPLLLAPNLWGRIYRPSNKQLTARAHGDGMGHGLRSVEALEEVFFLAHLAGSYLGTDFLHPHDLPPAVYQVYLSYQTRLRETSDHLYLAKNNNLLLRYASLRSQNPHFLAVFLFREPLAQADSLWRQHQHFSRLQAKDSFALRYMDWLGHHEFGLHHKPMRWDGDWQPSHEPTELAYWLENWCHYHQQLLNTGHAQTIWIDHADYAANPQWFFQEIGDRLGMKIRSEAIEAFPPKKPIQADLPEGLLHRAQEIYADLRQHRLSPP